MGLIGIKMGLGFRVGKAQTVYGFLYIRRGDPPLQALTGMSLERLAADLITYNAAMSSCGSVL